MIYAKKIKLIVTDEQALYLDAQSKKCNWLYNHLLQKVNDDHENNNGEKQLLYGRNLRNQVPDIKEEFPFLKTVYSVPLKNTAIRVKDAFVKMFKDKTGKVGHPKFRSFKKKWFSLYYDEPYVGYKIDGCNLNISFGKDEEGHQFRIDVLLSERLKLKPNCKLKNMRITKKGKTFFVVFTIEKEVVQPEQVVFGNGNRWIVFDPNHKNMMVGLDYLGRTIEFAKLTLVRYWDWKIDFLKSKRDKFEKKTRKYPTYEGSDRFYYKNSRMWEHWNKALTKAYDARREQIKQALHTMANSLAKNYDKVFIGDYVPSTETAKYKRQHRSMLNQTFIGSIRKTVDWVMQKSGYGKTFKKVDEYHTTKECPFCGFMEHKEPDVRLYTCPQCGTTYYRDIGSCLNMAVKENLLLRSDYVGWQVSQPMYTVAWSYKLCKWFVTTGDVADESEGRDWPLVLDFA